MYRKRLFNIFFLFIILTLASLQVSSIYAASFEETLSGRMSTHPSGTYTNQNITKQDLINILWAAYGFTSSGDRSIPSIGGNYSLIVFIVNSTGSYKFIPENNSIVLHNGAVTKTSIAPYDQRWPSEASAVLVVVWNSTKMDNQYFAAAEVGCLVQNVYLKANTLGLGTCSVGGIDSMGLQTALYLPSNLIPILIIPLGYPVLSYTNTSPNYAVMTGNLPPVQYSAKTLDEVINNRVNVKEWSSENLSLLDVSQLLWAAYGSSNTTHRTTPSAYDVYPLVIYVLSSSGVYKYIPQNSNGLSHQIEKILDNDRRHDVADACSGQTWAADAPVIFLVAYDSSRGGDWPQSVLSHEFIEVDAGCVIQDIFLESTAWTLGTSVVCNGLEAWNGTVAENLRNILNLYSNIIPLYVMPIGHPVKPVSVTNIVVRTPSDIKQVTTTDPWTEYYANVSVTTMSSFKNVLNITWVFNCTGTTENTVDDVRNHYTFVWTPDEGFKEPNLTGHLMIENCANASLSSSYGWFRLSFRFGKSASNVAWSCKVIAYLKEYSAVYRSSLWTMNTYIGFTLSSDSLSWGTLYPLDVNVSASNMPLNINVSSNLNVKIRMRGNGDLINGNYSIPLSNVYIGQTGLPTNNDGIKLTDSYQNWKAEITYSEDTSHPSYWFLTVPEGTPTGTYNFTFYIEISP